MGLLGGLILALVIGTLSCAQPKAMLTAQPTMTVEAQSTPGLIGASQDVGLQATATALQVLIQQQPEEARLHHQLGLLLASYAPGQSLLSLEQAVKLDPSLASVVFPLRDRIAAASAKADPAYTLVAAGQGLASQGEWRLALEAFQRAIQFRPDYAEAWAYLGEALQHQDQAEAGDTLAQSLPALQRAIELDPNSLAAHTFMALYRQRQQQFDQALQSLQTARRLAPNSPVVQAEIARNLALQGDLAAALQAYQLAITQTPGDLSYTRLLIEFCLKYDVEVRSLALPTARRLVNLAPGDPANQDVMAQVLVELGDLANAERFLWRALQADSDYAPAHLHLGVIYLLQGNSARAAQELDQARTLDPGGPAAQQAQRLLQNSIP